MEHERFVPLRCIHGLIVSSDAVLFTAVAAAILEVYNVFHQLLMLATDVYIGIMRQSEYTVCDKRCHNK